MPKNLKIMKKFTFDIIKNGNTKFWQNVQEDVRVCSNKNQMSFLKNSIQAAFFWTLGKHFSTPSAAVIRGRLQKVIPTKEFVEKGSPKNNNIQKIPSFQNGEFFWRHPLKTDVLREITRLFPQFHCTGFPWQPIVSRTMGRMTDRRFEISEIRMMWSSSNR